MTRKPYVFFYGGYMNPKVLAAAGVFPTKCTAGYVEGMSLTIAPIANLEDKSGARTYGLLTRMSHSDLEALYRGDPSALKGARYLPEAVLVQTGDGQTMPAMTYICPDLPVGIPDPDYVATLVEAAESLKLPADYQDHIRSFLR